MSDIAPFVAAVIRDRAVMEQQEEIAKLQNQLAQLRAVEVTGPKGKPVYAHGRLDEGNVNDDGVDQWVLILEQVQPCQLSELCSVKVRLGGALRGTFDNIHDQDMDSHPDNGENQKVIHFDVGGNYPCGVTVACKVRGWSHDSWLSAMNNGNLISAIESGGADALLDFLIKIVDEEQPRGKMVEFTDVTFEKGSIPPGILKF